MRRPATTRVLVSVLLASLLATTACSTVPIFDERTMISTRSSAVPEHEVLGELTVDWCNYLILLILPIFRNEPDKWDDLMKKARSTGADALIDVSGHPTKGSFFIPFYIQQCAEIRGTAVKFR